MLSPLSKISVVSNQTRASDEKKSALTAIAVGRLLLPARGEPQRVVWDSACHGLAVRLNHKGRVWIVQARGPDGRSARRTIGPADGPDALGLADARRRARQMRAQIEAGDVPPPLRKRADATAERPAGIPTFGEVREAFLADAARRLRSGSYRSLLNRPELAEWIDRPLAEITRGDIERAFLAVKATIERKAAASLAKREKAGRPVLVGELRKGAGVAGNRLLSALSSMFSWAQERRSEADARLKNYNPAIGWKTLRAVEAKRERPIEPADIPAIWRGAEAGGEVWARVYRLLILLSCRRAEIQGLRWDEVRDLDGDDPRLELGARSKAGAKLERAIPLTAAAVAIIKAVPKCERDVFVFGLDRPLADRSKIDGRIRAAAGLSFHWSPHSFRHAFARWARKAAIPADVARTCLGHSTGGYNAGALAAYGAGFCAPQLHRETLERWQNFLAISGCEMPAAAAPAV